MKVSIAGASGYVGGELLRLLLGHPHVEVGQVTSERYAGKYVWQLHPNLRKRSSLRFSRMQDLETCDILFLAMPHGKGLDSGVDFASVAPRIIDLSADYRLKDPAAYPRWYGITHPRPDLLERFVYGLPELHRERIRGAVLVSGAGCIATAAILGLMPLFKAGLVRDGMVVIEGKSGSSASGRDPFPASHHPERSEVIRPHEPVGHRHTAEIAQELEAGPVYLTTTSVNAVRGVLATCHVFLRGAVTEKDIWRAYREVYSAEPFVRIVKERNGLYRHPDPRVLWGSNYCDVGFEIDGDSDHLVVMSAVDNLMKGAAGNAVQAMNIMAGFDETAGLEFAGLHP
ncbi:MAG: N-acetyl-gamma-glutamyl-phosphate reductase [Ignavibacteriales bacterium]